MKTKTKVIIGVAVVIIAASGIRAATSGKNYSKDKKTTKKTRAETETELSEIEEPSLTTTTIESKKSETTEAVVVTEPRELENKDSDFSYEDFVRIFTEGDFSLVDPDFKAEMDAYEAIYDEYFAMMQKIADGSYDFISMFESYDAILKSWEECEEKMEAVDESKLSPADDAYFLYVQARILDKELKLIAGGLDSQDDEPVTERVQKQNTGDTNKVEIGVWTVDVPTYWSKSAKFERYTAYAESGERCAMLQMYSFYDEYDPVGFHWLEDENETAAIMTNYENGLKKSTEVKDFTVVSKEVIETKEIKALMWNIRVTMNGLPCSIKYVMYPSEKDNNWVVISCLVSDNTRYLYDDEFKAILQSIEPKE